MDEARHKVSPVVGVHFYAVSRENTTTQRKSTATQQGWRSSQGAWACFEKSAPGRNDYCVTHFKQK